MTRIETTVEIWTVGHSDRAADDLVSMLVGAGIEQIVDVRSAPWSRRYPWHAKAALERTLEQAGIAYRWDGAALGGQGDDSNARVLAGVDYLRALDELIRTGAARRTAILCAERDPRHCHRNQIADDLARRGVIVRHLIDPGFVEGHQSPFAFE